MIVVYNHAALLQIYSFTTLLTSQTQHSLETRRGSIPFIATVAIFTASDFSRVENLCLFLLLLSNAQLAPRPHSLRRGRQSSFVPCGWTCTDALLHLNLWKCAVCSPGLMTQNNTWEHALLTERKLVTLHQSFPQSAWMGNKK